MAAYVKPLSPDDHFDAVCVPGLKLAPEAIGKFGNLELIVAFRNFLGWRGVSCADFIPQTTSQKQTNWRRQAANTDECLKTLQKYEEGSAASAKP